MEKPYDSPIWTGECSKHGHWSADEIDSCPQCEREAYEAEQEYAYPHGLCADCDHADPDRSNADRTWCTAWKRRGFPVKIPRYKCKRKKITFSPES